MPVQASHILRKFGAPVGGLLALGVSLAASLTTLIWTTGDLNAQRAPAAETASVDSGRLLLAQADGGPKDPNYGGTPPPGYDGWMGVIQDWLARANRDYQGVIIKDLSQPADGVSATDEIARKLQESQSDQPGADEKPAPDFAQDTPPKAQSPAPDATAGADQAPAERSRDVAPVARQAPNTPPARDNVAAEAAAAAAAAQRLANELEELHRKQDEERRKSEAAQRRQEAQRLQDEQRQAEARIAEERRRADEAARAADAERARLAERAAEAERAQATQRAADAERTRPRPIQLTTEPIPRPRATGVIYRPELASPRVLRAAGYRFDRRKARRFARHAARVKGWSHRKRARGACYAAGRRIRPPGRYTVARGDSLWRISARHYRRGRLYRKIYRANRHKIRNVNLIYPCQRFHVPRRRR